MNHLLVSSLILPHSRSWDRGRLVELFNKEYLDAIQKIPIPSTPKSDKLVWILDNKGKFSVKSAL